MWRFESGTTLRQGVIFTYKSLGKAPIRLFRIHLMSLGAHDSRHSNGVIESVLQNCSRMIGPCTLLEMEGAYKLEINPKKKAWETL